mgnify:CR=1 FL=1
MSGNSVGKIFTQARLPAPASPSGTKISKSELKEAWTEALRPEAADPAGKPVQQAEDGEDAQIDQERAFRFPKQPAD